MERNFKFCTEKLPSATHIVYQAQCPSCSRCPYMPVESHRYMEWIWKICPTTNFMTNFRDFMMSVAVSSVFCVLLRTYTLYTMTICVHCQPYWIVKYCSIRNRVNLLLNKFVQQHTARKRTTDEAKILEMIPNISVEYFSNN